MTDSPFDVLLKVQDLDTQISQLQHRKVTMAERAELATAETALAAVDARAADAGARRQALLVREEELERQVTAVNQRRKTLEQRMYADRGSAARDLQAMNEEIHHLETRTSELEDVELELMEEQEPIDAELEQLNAERAVASEAVTRLRTVVAEAEVVVDTDLRAAQEARVAEAVNLPADLAERYEGLRARLKGTGAARLVGNRCDGCHLELPSVEVDRIRHLPPDEVVTCDQCGRILVRSGGSR